MYIEQPYTDPFLAMPCVPIMHSGQEQNEERTQWDMRAGSQGSVCLSPPHWLAHQVTF